MKKIKSIVAAIMVCVICLSLCSCAVKKEDVTGTWSSSWVYNGNEIACMFTLNENGKYNEVTFKNNTLYKVENGTYEIKGSKVILHLNGNEGISTEYKFRNDKLVNNKHEYIKSALDTSMMKY